MRKQTAICLAAVVVFGCVRPETRETREFATRISPDEAVVVLNDEFGIPACVTRAMQRNNATFKFISGREFRDALFPWFEPAIAPTNPNELALLIKKPLIEGRLSDLGVRYLIAISGLTTEGEGKGAAVGGHLGGLGAGWWDRSTQTSAIVWDLQKAHRAGALDVLASGTALMPVFILPFPFIPPTETTACEQLARKLAAFLAGGRPIDD